MRVVIFVGYAIELMGLTFYTLEADGVKGPPLLLLSRPSAKAGPLSTAP